MARRFSMSTLLIDGLLRFHRTTLGWGGIALLASSVESVGQPTLIPLGE